ncbi:MAG: hypothetical protein AAFY88_08130, partial [Acidobacteriota bacterium]
SRRACRRAIAAIHRRAGVSQSGELSIITPGALEGRLSRAEDPRDGALSFRDTAATSPGDNSK